MAGVKTSEGGRRPAAKPKPAASGKAPRGLTAGLAEAFLDSFYGPSGYLLYLVEVEAPHRVLYVTPNAERVMGERAAACLMEEGALLSACLTAEALEARAEGFRAARREGKGSWHLALPAPADGEPPLLLHEEAHHIALPDGSEAFALRCLPLGQSGHPSEALGNTLWAALEGIRHGFALYDRNDHLIACNRAFSSLYGLEPEDLRGLDGREIIRRFVPFCRRVRDWLGREREGPGIHELEELYRASQTRHYEFEALDGRWFHVSSHHMAGGYTTILRTDITDQKRSEESLYRSEVLKAGIIDAAMDCVVAVNAKGLVIEFNPAAEAAFGVPRQEALGRPFADIALPDDYPYDENRRVQDFLETGEGVEPGERVEFRAKRSDGSRFPAEISFSEIDLAGGRVTAINLRDITEQKVARRERKHLIQLLRDAIESIPHGFAIYDANERLVLCNEAFAAPYGKKAHAMRGMTVADAFRRALVNTITFDGQPVAALGGSLEKGLERIWETTDRPLEVQWKSGEWKLLTANPTADGGTVFLRTDITTLKKAEASLRESEQLFRRIVEGQPAPVWMVEVSSGRILYASPAAAALFRIAWPPKKALNVHDFYADSGDRAEIIHRLQTEGWVENYEVQLQKSDGEKFWVSTTCNLVTYEGSEAVISCMLDMTERRSREAELRQARETLEDAIESLSEGFALYDNDDRLVLCNQRYREFNAQTADMLQTGVRWTDFIRAGAERGQYATAVGRIEEWVAERRAARRGHSETPIQFQQNDGRWFQVSNQPTRQGGYVAIRTDITAQKRMEAELRESEERFRRIVEENPLPVVMTEASTGRVIYESPACRALFGRDRVPDPPASYIDHYADLAQREQNMQRLYSDGVVQGAEVLFRRLDGSTFWALIASRLIDYHGEKVIVAVVNDLTQRHEQEAELARQREALYQSEKLSALGSLLAGVAHELNNPLSIVVGQALLLHETATDPAIAERAAKIGKAADRCARIVKAFLAMARQRPPQKAAIDLDDLLDSVLEMLGHELQKAGIEIRRRRGENLPPAWADADQVNQVLVNLVMNAQQAMEELDPPRVLLLQTSQKNGEVSLVVADNGPGIPEEIRSRIFEPFFSTKEMGKGTGVGLAVSYGIIEAHGGRLSLERGGLEPAEGGEGRGARFRLTLPAVAGRRERAPCMPAKPEGLPCRLLVIDDEPEIAATLEEILGVEGHTVILAGSGEEALQALARDSYDLILCDLKMPGMDGRSFHRVLSESRPELLSGLAYITGDTFAQEASAFFEQSGVPYLEKPFTPAEVRQLIARLLAGELQEGEESRGS